MFHKNGHLLAITNPFTGYVNTTSTVHSNDLQGIMQPLRGVWQAFIVSLCCIFRVPRKYLQGIAEAHTGHFNSTYRMFQEHSWCSDTVYAVSCYCLQGVPIRVTGCPDTGYRVYRYGLQGILIRVAGCLDTGYWVYRYGLQGILIRVAGCLDWLQGVPIRVTRCIDTGCRVS